MTLSGSVSRYLSLVLFITTLATEALFGQLTSFEQPPIDYVNAKVNDGVTRLSARIESGQTTLEHDVVHGYLKSVLEELEIPVSSQMLVFSKTSMQMQRISPDRPRAVYFNDDIYVGWCQYGQVIEIAANDSNQGPTFYTLNQSLEAAPSFIRDQGQCTVCHASSNTQYVPGLLVRSVFPGESGHPNYGSGTYTTDQTSPFNQRWGGWYVTGTHGAMRHMGNRIYEESERNSNLELGANRIDLNGLVSTGSYLSSHSDIVALMVLEHQTQMQNAITFANFETRQALHQSKTMNQALDREPEFISESTQRRINAAAKNVLKHLLMCDEFPLTDNVSGTSDFASQFANRGPRDSKARTLRDFDLEKQLFRYPCSYLIYSASFDALPVEVRLPVIDGLIEILEGRNTSDEFTHLSAEARAAILEILRDTKPQLFQKQR